MLRGSWLKDTFKKKAEARALIEIAVESQIVWAVAVVQAGADIVTLADPQSSGSSISTKTFEAWSLPYLKRVCDAVKKAGAKTILHVCGDISDRLKSLSDVGADILQVDSMVNLSLVRETLGPDQVLMGNVNTSDPLVLGTPEQVYEQAKKAIEIAGRDGGLILSGGCMISEVVPPANIEALVQAGHEVEF